MSTRAKWVLIALGVVVIVAFWLLGSVTTWN